jgi:hypothetical protein
LAKLLGKWGFDGSPRRSEQLSLRLDEGVVVDAAIGKRPATHLDLLLGFTTAVGALEKLEQLETKLDVGRVQPDEIADQRKGPLGVVAEAGHGFGQNGDAKLTAITTGPGQPSLELFEIGELEVFEEVASEERGELHERFGIEGAQAGLGCAYPVQIDVDVTESEPDALSIGDDARPAVFIEQRPKLAQTPAQAATRIVGDVPEEIAELLSAMLAAGRREVAEQGACLLRGRQIERFAAPLDAERAQESQC